MTKVYISSTFTDLKPFREAVIQALRKAGYVIEAMEDYVATGNHPPLSKCLADIEKCDYYIGIFAWRYGFIPQDSNPERRSITESEYRKAQELDKPCFIFLLDSEAPWSPKFMDSSTGEGEGGKRIKAFRDELQNSKLTSFFKTPEELATLAAAALSRWQQEAVSEDEDVQIMIQTFDLEDSDKLLLDLWPIELINITLEAAYKRHKSGQLTPEEIREFNILRRQVRDLLGLNKKLQTAAQKARQLLKKTIESIRSNLKEMSSNNMSRFEESEILEQFQGILEAGGEAAEWLDLNRATLVKKASEHAFKSYPAERKSASPENIEDFEWELTKYLKRISHCLIWSNYNLIDEPDGLKTMPLYVYQSAFKYIKEKRVEQNSPDISSVAIGLLVDCFDHLLKRLS